MPNSLSSFFTNMNTPTLRFTLCLSLPLALTLILTAKCLAVVPIVVSLPAAEMEQLAARDLADGLARRLYPDETFPLAVAIPEQGRCILVLNAGTDREVLQRLPEVDLPAPESFVVATVGEG